MCCVQRAQLSDALEPQEKTARVLLPVKGSHSPSEEVHRLLHKLSTMPLHKWTHLQCWIACSRAIMVSIVTACSSKCCVQRSDAVPRIKLRQPTHSTHGEDM